MPQEIPTQGSEDDSLEMLWTAGNHPSKRETEHVMQTGIRPDEATAFDDPEHHLPSERELTPDEREIHNFGKEGSSGQLPN